MIMADIKLRKTFQETRLLVRFHIWHMKKIINLKAIYFDTKLLSKEIET
jgi:hypothetical protein